ncbi:hypothetical protein E1B28_000214 [Marasmius oreades]|uniref:DUF2421 domain-containing protein n=1 Tax=Marasmius oreades TaxID=181124 RepID=A0A9P7V0Z7_9AGAR|nr:uncharacterized protein E1B28_000214 [Marasmius oreades]KAG7098252.1 hypothetical protein E1B28_000214 [Marasmius oreades]
MSSTTRSPSWISIRPQTPYSDNLVGSPESESILRTNPSNPEHVASGSGTQPRSRPNHSVFSSQKRPATSTGFSLSIPKSPKEPEWTVFGQLMEDQLGTPTPSNASGVLTTPLTGRPYARKSQAVQAQKLQRSGETTPRGSLADSYFGATVQSPVLEQANPFGDSTDRIQSDSDSSSSSSDSDTDTETESTASTFRSSRRSVHLQDNEEPPPPSPPKWYSPQRLPQIPVLYRNIIKCSIAYFVGSLFTYNDYLSSFVSDIAPYGTGGGKPLPTGHMIATVAVYFNPAKTMGGMLEADIFCVFGLFYSAFVALTSMSMFWWLDVQPGLEWLADVIAIVWVGVSMSILAWLKLWMANPQFGTACSMMSIIIFVVVVKEGGLDTLLQVTFIVFCGIGISNLVCYLIWPTAATSNLQTNMTKTLDSFSTLLSMVTDTFVLEESHCRNKNQAKLQRAVEAHQSSFTSLKKNLKEARGEWMFWGRFRTENMGVEEEEEEDCLVDADVDRVERGQNGVTSTIKMESGRESAYEDAVDSLNRLGQHLNGLRSGTGLQYELLKAGVVGMKPRYKSQGKRNASASASASPLVDVTVPDSTQQQRQAEDDEETAMLKAAAAMFGDLVDDLGPPLKALSTTCTTSLKRLRESFVQSHMQIHHHHRSTSRSNNRRSKTTSVFNPTEFGELVSDIERALRRFESTSNHAVMRLYRKSDVVSTLAPMAASHSEGETLASSAGSVRSMQGPTTEKDNMFLTSQDNEHVFLVYFFIFTLQEFSRELVSLVDAMERIYAVEQQRTMWSRWWGRLYTGFVGGIRGLWRGDRRRRRRRAGNRNSSDVNPSSKSKSRHGGTLRRRISQYINPEKLNADGTRPWFPKIKPHAPDTILTPSRKNLSFMGKMKQRLWAFGKRLTERDAKYAIKTGMATAILASPAFFDSTRPMFIRWYGDWALISYFVVMSPTVGGTNFMGVHRVLGTLFSAVVAATVYSLFPENAVVLAVFGFFYSIPCFYFLVGQPKYAPSARFVLLTYNLTCLYCYNLRVRDISVIEIAEHRAVAVTVGVIWAWLVSRYWWPTEARRELSRTLGEFCLNMGWLYTRLAASNSGGVDVEPRRHEGSSSGGRQLAEVGPQRVKLNASIQDFMAMELHLQIQLIEMQGLLAQTQHEPRLKGPFPIALYRGILTSLQTILDRLHSMRCVTTREEWYTSVRKDFILPVQNERRDMVGNTILFFSILASAFQLKTPLPPYLPPAEESRQRLVDAIRRLEIVRNRDVKGSRQLLFFAYALTMKGVTQELKNLGRTLQEAFGVIGQSPEEFEALFEYESGVRR